MHRFIFSASTWAHLRIPFSIFLMPVFLLAWSLLPEPEWWRVVVVFVSLHLFLYPASNGYNSYFDKDEESIGGLERPPAVEKELYYASLLFDGIALLLGALLGWQYVAMLFVYGLISKMYSHPMVRLKAMPIAGWLAAGVFQGAFTFAMAWVGMTGDNVVTLSSPFLWMAASLSTVILLGSYPMTQVYQHEEDGRRGDETISRRLGVLGTFHFTMAMFGLASAGFAIYYLQYYTVRDAVLYFVILGPVLIYFFGWYIQVRRDRSAADFRRTMRLNAISSLCLSAYFVTFWFLHHL